MIVTGMSMVLSPIMVIIMVIQHTRYTMALRAYTAYRQTDTRQRTFGKNYKMSGKKPKHDVNKLLFLPVWHPCAQQSLIVCIHDLL